MKLKIAMCAALLIGGCVADKAPQPAAPSAVSSPPMIAGQQVPAAKVEITSAAGEIHIGQLHIGKSSPPQLAQCFSPSLPAAGGGQRAENEDVDSRQAGDAPAAVAGAGGGVVNEPEERTDAVPARPKLLRLK